MYRANKVCTLHRRAAAMPWQQNVNPIGSDAFLQRASPGDPAMDACPPGACLDVRALIREDHHRHLAVLRPHVENKRVLQQKSKSFGCALM